MTETCATAATTAKTGRLPPHSLDAERKIAMTKFHMPQGWRFRHTVLWWAYNLVAIIRGWFYRWPKMPKGWDTSVGFRNWREAMMMAQHGWLPFSVQSTGGLGVSRTFKTPALGRQYLRDPEYPCEFYKPSSIPVSRWEFSDNCDGDGHYLCAKCRNKKVGDV